jgi:hypothetical protein
MDRQMEIYFFGHVHFKIRGSVEYQSCSEWNFSTTDQNLASFDNRPERYEFYTTERMAVFSGNCAWMERFSDVILVYAYIGKIMDM